MFRFGLNVTVVARFRLREGLNITADEIAKIEQGEVRQDCFDSAMRSLQRRLHSRSELERKLIRSEHPAGVVTNVLDDLTRLGYLDDKRFATTKAQSAAQHRKYGKRRAQLELRKAGVSDVVTRKALEDVYEPHDSTKVARELAEKQRARLMKLDPIVARRRLTGMLLRRGFDFDEIRPVLNEVLGHREDN